MTPLALKAIFTTIALLVPGAVAVGYVATEMTGSEVSTEKNHAQALFGGEVLQAFTGEVAPDVTTGVLDFRTFDGNVYVSSWDRAAYEVTVLYDPSGNGQRLGDSEVEVAFEDAGAKTGTLDLALAVRETGSLDFAVNDRSRDDLAVVAFVPDLLYERLAACSGATSGLALPSVLPGSRDLSDACVEGGPIGGDIMLMDDGASKPLRVPFLVNGIRATELSLTTTYGSLALENVEAEKVALVSEYGNVMTNATTAGALGATTEYGNVMLYATDAKALVVETQYGSVHVETRVLGDATASIASEYGDIIVLAPGASDRGYVVDAATSYGEIEILLPDLERDARAKDDSGRASALGKLATSALASPAVPKSPQPGPRDREAGDSVHVQTKDLHAREHVLELALETEYGNILVMDLDAEPQGKIKS